MRCTSSGRSVIRRKRADHRRAEGQVGHEVAVHHVHVDPLRAAFDGALHLLPQPSEIGAQHAGCDAHAHCPPPRPELTSRSTDEPRGRPLPGGGRTDEYDVRLLPGCHPIHPADLHPRSLQDALGELEREPHHIGHADRRGAAAHHQLHRAVGWHHHLGRRVLPDDRAPRHRRVGALAFHPDPEAELGQPLAGIGFRQLQHPRHRVLGGEDCAGGDPVGRDARSPRAPTTATRPRSRPKRRHGSPWSRRALVRTRRSSSVGVAAPKPGPVCRRILMRGGAAPRRRRPSRVAGAGSSGLPPPTAAPVETSRWARAGTPGARARNRSTWRSFSSGSSEQVE